ncbi:MAG: TPM domain-containing protein [Polyangiaceae bacterium]
MRPSRAFRVWLLLLVIWAWPSRSLAQTAAPVLTHPVTDLAQVLDSDVESELNDLLVVHSTDHHAQIALLTVSSTLGEPIEDYSLRVAKRWAGGRAGADDGILVVVAVADRRMRIELGYGAETLITDAEARRILDDVRPRLRKGDYAGAAREICGKLMKKTGGVVPQGYVPPRPPPEPAVPAPWRFIGLFLLASVIGVLGWSKHTQSAATEEDEDTDEDADPNADEEEDLDWAPFREPSLLELLRVRAFVITVGVAVVVSALIGQLMGWGPEFGLCGLVGAIAGWRFLWRSISSLGHVVILLGIVFACFALMQDTALYVSAFGALILGLLHASWNSSGGGGVSWGGFSRDNSFWNPSSPSTNSGSFWSSSSSDSGSLWSSSSSSSTWDSGSSSSSSDYSGGGGSFGGGGASSSW